LALETNPRPHLVEWSTDGTDEYKIIQQGEGRICVLSRMQVIRRIRVVAFARADAQAPGICFVCIRLDLLDSPPVLPVHDASILADLCDGVLFVVNAGATESALAGKPMSEFRRKNLLGVVSDVTQRSDSYGGHPYDSEYKRSSLL